VRAEFLYWVRKLQARFFAGDYASAIETASRAQPLLWSALSELETVEYCFYDALSRASSCDSAAADTQQQHRDAVAAYHEQLQLWATNCPDNFENRAALVGAEIARIDGHDNDAMRLYEQAIRSARANGFIQQEALANELAARFYAARGFEKIARVYLQDARYGYLRWGADGKVRQLDGTYPHLMEEQFVPASTRMIGTPVEHLDLATVIKVSQTVSSEIVLERLLDTLMRTAIAHAGAERGLLILSRGTEPRIEAEATTGGDTIAVRLRDEAVTGALLPESVLHYILRTRESVILDDASADSAFSADPYILQHRARSILCVPLITQAKLVGLLYLENNLTSGVFAPGRIAVLKLLASQAAIALENAGLYRDLAEREAKIRRLVDANIIGICISMREGEIVEANDAFLKMGGYDREDLVTGRLRWTDLTPPEWYDRSARGLEELQRTGAIQPFEKEYFRKDGSRVPVLVGVAGFSEQRDQLVAFVLDLTERKRAEEQAHESERRYHEVDMELAHTNRVATMGQLSASIAHEVSQPIAAAFTNAQAGLRWLNLEQPDVEEARQALGRIIKNVDRAGEVLGRIRALIKKAPTHKEYMAMNDAIREVITLTLGEVTKNGAVVHTQLADDLPLIQGDRVQLQQVILNLIINAVEAMAGSERPRELWISTKTARTGDVHVAVRDSGPGLDPAKLERLFEAFYTTKAGGMGMGLSICRSIVEAHEGQLWAEANEPQGAIFQFTVPTHP
jgi:PAS domain S-box-containing protein